MSQLKRTPLYDLHLELGGKMVPFAGYDMPVQYPLGIKKEHEWTRASCGLFDVSHMGQILLHGPRPAEALETLVCADIVSLPQGMQRYAIFTAQNGGILDDLMVANPGGHLYLVVNAACKDQDIALLEMGLDDEHRIEVLDRGLLALQGPKAADVMQRHCPAACELTFMQQGEFDINGVTVWISRSGYTGEDGFEISIPAEETEAVEAGLIWAVGKARRHGGERPGGFPGADVILHQIDSKEYQRKRIGLLGEGRAPVREGAELYSEAGQHIGVVTSGGFGPNVGKPVAMGYVDVEHAVLDTTIYAEVRGKRLPMTISKMPFVAPGYHRG